MAATKAVGTKKAINQELEELKGVHEKLAELEAKAADTVTQIRGGFEECAVVFIDLVGSTKFKIDNAKTPEKWILRVQQFSALLAQYVTSLGGEVVKYIGDEVMASFTGGARVNNAVNLLLRVDEIQAALTEVTKTPTQIKVAADLGPVYFLKFDEHKALDPQGTPVDRCARIAKHTQPGTVLASYEFSKATPPGFIKWSKVGTLHLKGLGATSIYKLGDPTFSVVDTEEIPVTELEELRARVTSLTSEVETLTMRESDTLEKNRRLQQQLEEAGQEVDDADKADAEEEEEESAEDAWAEIDALIDQLAELVRKAPAPESEYARFLFLYSQDAGDTYNRYERTFDKCIEAKLVIRPGDTGFYQLNTDHRLNKRAIKLMDELDPLLQHYEEHHRDEDDDELFQYRLSDPAFWENKIGFNVG